MNTVSYTLLLVAIASFICAQTDAPELAPIATKYNADIAALEAQRTAAIAQAQKPYVAALATSEKNATTAGNVATVSTITSERAALNTGLMTPGFPPGMPKELQNSRKAYLDAVNRIKAAEAPRRQALDAAYLRAITSLLAKAPKESKAAKQLEAERQRLLASAPAASGSKSNSKSVVVNGTFDAADALGNPAGWAVVEGFKVVRDGTNNVLHASARLPGYLAISQDIPLPPKARNVTLGGRARGKVVTRDPNQGHFGSFIGAVYVDAKGTTNTSWIFANGSTDAEWNSFSVTQKIPDDMKGLQVVLVLKYVGGEFDFDDIEVEFR